MPASNHISPSSANDDITKNLGLDQASSHRGRYKKWSGIALVIIVTVIFIMQFLGNGKSPGQVFKTANIYWGPLTVAVTATGTLQPVNQVEVGSEISGTIRKVLVDFNDRVIEGQVLAIMDTDQLQARVNQATAALALSRAKVQQAEATVVESKSKLRRARELQKSGMCSEQDCDAAQATYDRALADLASNKAQVVQAQASLDAEQTTLEKATIHSPINGIVLNRDVEPGQTVAASFQTPVLFTLAENLAQMELHVDVDEADVGKIAKGQSAEFTVDAYPDRRFPASITEVHFASQTVEGVVTYETVLAVDNSELLLRPGMTATADIIVKQLENALLIPNIALHFSPPLQQDNADANDRGLVGNLLPHPPRITHKQRDDTADDKTQRVWILRDAQPVAIPVITGSTDGISTEIISGDIEAGMAVITDTINNPQ
ncbi:MAG: efflux RND transporter periplasmic adaptor subunit [Gammaproteobacteria bacterium]